MEVTGQLIQGIVDLTKMLAHGAMHEACLIEVIKTIETEAFIQIKEVQTCVNGNNNDYKNSKSIIDANKSKNNSTLEIEELIRRMLNNKNSPKLDKKLKKKLLKLKKDLAMRQNNFDFQNKTPYFS